MRVLDCDAGYGVEVLYFKSGNRTIEKYCTLISENFIYWKYPIYSLSDILCYVLILLSNDIGVSNTILYDYQPNAVWSVLDVEHCIRLFPSMTSSLTITCSTAVLNHTACY